MANLPNRADIAGAPSKANAQAAFTALYDFVASRFARGTSGVSAATEAELSSARASLGLGSFTGKNLLINGNFLVNQRSYVSGTATAGANQYTLDRWRVVASGQSLAFVALGNGREITAPAGGVEQVIEGFNIAGGNYVLNWSGTATASVGGTARTKGEVFTLPAGANVTIRFTGGTVSVAQLEPGAVVTIFEARHYGVELALCQRYYFIETMYVPDAASLPTNWFFKVAMRTTPTITGGNAGYTTFGVSTNSASHRQTAAAPATVVASAEF